MLKALTFISLREWQAHKFRMALTIVGITLGVSVYFAIRTANTTLLDSLKLTVEKLAGKATLQVTAGESGFPEQLLDIVRATPGVENAEPVIEVVARPALEGAGNLLILGIDAADDQKLREYQFDPSQTVIGNPLDYISKTNSIMITQSFADRHGLKIGDNLPLYTNQGKQEFEVLGIFKPSGIGEVFGGQIAVMDIYAAQYVFNRGNNFDRIDVKTDPNTTAETVQQRLRERLPAGIEVIRPVNRGKNIENAVATMSQGFLLTSLIALLVAVFIVFNAFSIAVNQRWKEIGILRALGVERSRVERMFLGEAALIGAIGSFVGVGVGFVLAVGANKIMSGIAATTYGVLPTPGPPIFRVDYGFEALVLGVGASLAGSWLPARSASHLDPALALHNIESRHKDVILKLAKLPVGMAVVAAGLALIAFTAPRVGVVFQLGYAGLILLGLVLMLPKLAELMGYLLRPVMDRVFGSEGVLAVDSMIRAPLRTTAVVGALMIGLGFVFATGAFIHSQKRVVVRSINSELTSDIYVAATDLTRSRTYHFSEELGQRIAAVPGVKSIENLRLTFVPYGGDNVALIAIEMDGWFARVRDIVEEGDEARARELMPMGEGFLISLNFSTRWNVRVGDNLQLETPMGTLSRPVLGVIEDYTSEKGTVLVDRQLYKTYWQDNAVDFFDVNLEPGVDQEAVKSDIQRALAGNHRAFVYTNGEYKRWIISVVDQFFTLNYTQMAVAIFVAAIGIINTLIISVTERRREIGIIRAIGGLRRQVRNMVLLEAVAIAIVGIVTAVIKGVCDTYFLVNTASAVLAGYTIPFYFPGWLILQTTPLVIIIGLVAAWWPARNAVNLNVIEVLGAE